MPRHSQHCQTCPWTGEVFVAPDEHPPCPACGGATERLWVGRSTAVTPDEWPGGQTFENLGHEPVTVYSRSELRRELRRRGLEPLVRHVPVPGTDKSPHTTSWDVPTAKTLRDAQALLARVGRVEPQTPETERPVYPLATPALVKDVWDAWPR